MAARRWGRNAGLDQDGILQTLFPDDPQTSDEDMMNYSSESEYEYHHEDGYSRDYQEEEQEIYMELEDDALTELQPGDPLGPLCDQSHLRGRNSAPRSSAASGSEQLTEVPSAPSAPRSPVPTTAQAEVH